MRLNARSQVHLQKVLPGVQGGFASPNVSGRTPSASIAVLPTRSEFCRVHRSGAPSWPPAGRLLQSLSLSIYLSCILSVVLLQYYYSLISAVLFLPPSLFFPMQCPYRFLGVFLVSVIPRYYMRLNLLLGSARDCPGSACISPVWLERCNSLSLSVLSGTCQEMPWQHLKQPCEAGSVLFFSSSRSLSHSTFSSWTPDTPESSVCSSPSSSSPACS